MPSELNVIAFTSWSNVSLFASETSYLSVNIPNPADLPWPTKIYPGTKMELTNAFLNDSLLNKVDAILYFLTCKYVWNYF